MFKALGFLGRVAASAFIATITTQLAVTVIFPLIAALIALLSSTGIAAVLLGGTFIALMNRIGEIKTV